MAPVLFCLLLWLESATEASNYTLAIDLAGLINGNKDSQNTLSRILLTKNKFELLIGGRLNLEVINSVYEWFS